MAAQRGPSTLGSWSATILRAAAARGVDASRLAQAAGIDPATLQEPEARVPRAALTRLWQLAFEATGDPAFCLTAARHAAQTSFHGVGYSMMASATIKEAFERLIRYRRLIGDVIQLGLAEREDRYDFLIDVSAPPGAPFEAVDAIVATLLGQARMITGNRNFAPRRVHLRRPLPKDPAPYRQSFRTEVGFGQPENVIEWAKDDLENRLPAGNAELARQNEQVLAAFLDRLERQELGRRVEQAIVNALPNGTPTKEAIARQLGMSPRNLQRRLAEESTSFKELIDAARITLARDYIDAGRLSVTEIAFVLGFGDTSSFSRAFKRWTKTSPRDYARRHASR